MPSSNTPDINHRRELRQRLDRQSFDDCSPELLRALVAVFDLASQMPPVELVRGLRVVR
ncbi:hypothetical protein [Mycobacterium innocens]|uniref:hypothetical protein n=1 Tax=Mycobacterium innocens TaxID=2341083 RepID=UPI000A73D420|nr:MULTISPECIES: hypothetical protein [Mycobacterium]